MSFVYERKTELPAIEWGTFVGNPPKDLGFVDLNPVEMMFWLYTPISTPGMDKGYVLPPNLQQFEQIVRRARLSDPLAFRDGFVYLTAKTLFVSGEYIGNRPGWHCDGFGTDDLNFIWADRAPTEFITSPKHKLFTISADCDRSMEQMEQIGKLSEGLNLIETYPDKHLLRLDRTVIHRSPVNFETGMRTFVKVSISKDRYDLIGNAINHSLLCFSEPRVPRRESRNHPASGLNQ
jgi:hypothetical protein